MIYDLICSIIYRICGILCCSISDQTISSVAFNKTGDWIALACSGLGQLLVWEWQSETYVLKQQGHFNNISCLSYSPDGQFIATGGEDGKVQHSHMESLDFVGAIFVDCQLFTGSKGFNFMDFFVRLKWIDSVLHNSLRSKFMRNPKKTIEIEPHTTNSNNSNVLLVVMIALRIDANSVIYR